MPLKYKTSSVKAINFNEQDVNKVLYNGTTVWERITNTYAAPKQTVSVYAEDGTGNRIFTCSSPAISVPAGIIKIEVFADDAWVDITDSSYSFTDLQTFIYTHSKTNNTLIITRKGASKTATSLTFMPLTVRYRYVLE